MESTQAAQLVSFQPVIPAEGPYLLDELVKLLFLQMRSHRDWTDLALINRRFLALSKSSPSFRDVPSYMSACTLHLGALLELKLRIEKTLSSNIPLRQLTRIQFSAQEAIEKRIRLPHAQVGDYFIQVCAPGTVLVKKNEQEKRVPVSFASNGGCDIDACIGIPGPFPLLAILNSFHGVQIWNLDQMMASEEPAKPIYANRDYYATERPVDSYGYDSYPVYHCRQHLLAIAYPDHVWVADFSVDPFKPVIIPEKSVQYIEFSLTHAFLLTREGYTVYRLAGLKKEAAYVIPTFPYIGKPALRCGRLFAEDKVILVFADQWNKTIVVEWKTGKLLNDSWFNPDPMWNSDPNPESGYIPEIYNKVRCWDADRSRLFLVHSCLKRLNDVWGRAGSRWEDEKSRWISDLQLLNGESIKKIYALGNFVVAITSRGIRLFHSETLDAAQTHLIAERDVTVDLLGRHLIVKEIDAEHLATLTVYDLTPDQNI